MIKKDVWFDKLIEDKVKYFNKYGMSVELFSSKLGCSPQEILDDLERADYTYIACKHKIEKKTNLGCNPEGILFKFFGKYMSDNLDSSCESEKMNDNQNQTDND